MKIKFNDSDRKLVIAKLEEIQKTRIEQMKPSRKLYKDSNGLFYLICGGSEDWHGINKNVLNLLSENNKEGAFVIEKNSKQRWIFALVLF
ncbi:MAG: hypothetical protein HW421_707 [Ignavibacteria bacterium]|nr:hypothetical protein [Ignavibacteria bacterium]